MNNNFIIVIEVDNKRAQAAYNKGLEDLAIVWPQLMKHADVKDTKATIEYNSKLLVFEEKKKAYELASKNYEREYAIWFSKKFNKGDRPESPYPEYHRYYPMPPASEKRFFESVKAELKSKADLANAAIGPYRMTEYQVKEMIAWEDGSRIEELMKEIK